MLCDLNSVGFQMSNIMQAVYLNSVLWKRDYAYVSLLEPGRELLLQFRMPGRNTFEYMRYEKIPGSNIMYKSLS